MTQNINAKIDQFKALIRNPKAWQVLGLKSWGLNKEDAIKYIEVDNSNNPTGRDIIGVVKYIGTGDITYKDKTLTTYYCDKIQAGIGVAVVGKSLIVN